MRILLVGGGTAGHIFPTISVAKRLTQIVERNTELSIVCGSRELDHLLYQNTGFETIPLPVRGLIGISWWRLPWHLLLLIWSCIRMFRRFYRYRPHVVIASGGYVSAPVLLASWLHRVPSVIFSGDAALGWATRILAPLTTVATVAFRPALSQISRTHCEVVGYPIRAMFESPDRSAGRAAAGAPEGRPLVLVMGGSQGAHVITEALRTDLRHILKRAHVVHISGRTDYQSLLATRELLPEPMRAAYRLHDFIDDGFADLLAAANIVVSRAGATSVAELSAVGTAAVLIPGTFGASHQVKTAEAMVAAGAAVVLREQDLSPNKMADTVLKLLDDPDRLTEMESASRTRGQPNAAQNIARIGLRLAHCSNKQVGTK